MNLKWPQLGQLLQKPRILSILESQDPYLLDHTVGLIKKYHPKCQNTVTQAHFISSEFVWRDWLAQLDQGPDFFAQHTTQILYLYDTQLNKTAQDCLALAVKHASDHAIFLVINRLRKQNPWLKAWEGSYYHLQYWPMTENEFCRWLQQTQMHFDVSLNQNQLTSMTKASDSDPSIALNVLRKLQFLPKPHSDQQLEVLLNQSRPINLFDLQRALIQGNIKQANHYFQNLLLEKISPSLLNWLFKNELNRLFALIYSKNIEQSLTALGVHFTQKKAYATLCRAWSEKNLLTVLRYSEQADMAIVRNDLPCAIEYLRDVMHRLLKPNIVCL